jgi:tetrahydromethanopterin S-methyltransferase subunit D
MTWVRMQMESLVVVGLAAGSGLWLLIRPSTMMQWVQESHPEAPLDSAVGSWIIRSVGMLLLVFAILIFASVLRAG